MAPDPTIGRPAESATWRPPLSALRLLADGRTAAMLAPDASVQWWCAPEFDDPPLCWRLLDEAGGTAGFPALQYVDADDAPAAASTTTLLRDAVGVIEVRDGLLSRDGGVVLVRLLRRTGAGPQHGPVEHQLRLGGFDAPPLLWSVDGDEASGTSSAGASGQMVRVVGGSPSVQRGVLHSRLEVTDQGWTSLAISVGLDAAPGSDAAALADELAAQDLAERRRLESSRLPRIHPERAVDALAVLRSCTSRATGAVVAAPTTSLPEAPGHDRQFDYRYTWLRDASLSTAVAALLGQAGEARRYLDFVLEAWGDRDLLSTPMLSVRGGDVPGERDVAGVQGWAGSRPVRVGNGASGQRQYDSLGLFAEAVSVYVQVGGRLDQQTWHLLSRLADQIAEDDPGEVKDSNGIWELRSPLPLVDGDIGRWLLLDRALWIARGWRPLTRRRHWRRARDTIRARVLAAIDEQGLLPQAYGQQPALEDRVRREVERERRGLLPQAYGQQPARPDASSLMAVAFGMFDRDDPRAGRLVEALLHRLGAGPYLYRYPPGGDDGFAGTEGAFLPMSFLAVTALAKLGRVEQARQRLDRLCAALPRLLSEEVDPQTGALLGNTPLVWSHAELARAIYVLDAAERRDRWGAAALWGWRLRRYVRLRRELHRREPGDAPRPEGDELSG